MFDRKPCPTCEAMPANARQLVKRLTDQAEYAAELPPYERVVGVHQAHQALAAALTARTADMRSTEPLSAREVMMSAVIDAVIRQRFLLNASNGVYAEELIAATRQVDAALAALAAHDFDAALAVTR